jgi:hypothetical protein
MFETQINLNDPTASGWVVEERNFHRDVWKPTQEASGLDLRPHECPV